MYENQAIKKFNDAEYHKYSHVEVVSVATRENRIIIEFQFNRIFFIRNLI